MSNSDKNTLSFQRIAGSDTISQFMEKVNNNFEKINKSNGGPAGVKGDDGNQGVPTKPKVPIHVWVAGEDYSNEIKSNDSFEIVNIYNNLSNVKYQEGHLIILENAHLYRLEKVNVNLKPKYILSLQSYDPASIVNGKNAYVHLAYADNADGDGFVKQDDISNGLILNTDKFVTDNEFEPEIEFDNNTQIQPLNTVSTFALTNNNNINNILGGLVNGNVLPTRIDVSNKAYMGIYTNNNATPSNFPEDYTWLRIRGTQGIQGEQGEQGIQGPKGEKGETGDGYTGHLYSIDLEGDMSNISIDINGHKRYENDSCKCSLHAYYGNNKVKVNADDVIITLPKEYEYSNNEKTNIILTSDRTKQVGTITKTEYTNGLVDITFTPDKSFVFPKNTIVFSISVNATIEDGDDGKTYKFVKTTVWMVKGIMSTFELEILPQYHTIKLFDDGQYYPEKLLVTVYKVEDGKREVFDFSKNTDFKLLYKNLDDGDEDWKTYPDGGVNTTGVSCLEFKVVRNGSEIWDYEDVWVVADGKSAHYYHADLGSTESMMVLTTGRRININDGSEGDPIYCAELRNESGYSITFEPKFYDGTTELEVTEVNIGSIHGEEYANAFEKELKTNEGDSDSDNGIKTYEFTITNVPFGVDMIPMTFDIRAKCPKYDNFGNIVGEEHKNDTVSFNVYISTLSSLYTLVPTVSAYNTSTGKTGDTIGCNVYKNDIHIPYGDLDENALSLKYIVRDGGTGSDPIKKYTEPLIYGHDFDNIKDEFGAKDVAIEFILYYDGNEVARSTVPLIADGIDGKDGNSWQYIFCRSPYYPFSNTGISDPSNWKNDDDTNYKDSNSEYLGEKESGYENIEDDKKWYDDHKGVDAKFRYEYQSYRKWDKENKCWGTYGEPTLYSNYSEDGKDGSGYTVLLSNPVAVIPVGNNDWSVDENASNQYDSTLVYLYNNTSDISANSNVSISLPSQDSNEYVKYGNFIISDENGVNKVIFRPVYEYDKGKYSIFDFGSNTQYKLPITLTYTLGEDKDGDSSNEHFSTTVNWTLSPIKGLEDVEVFVDKRVVNTSITNKHEFRVGYYLISSNGSRKFIEDRSNGNINNYNIFLTDTIDEIPTAYEFNWQKVTYEFGENKNCYVVLVDSNKKIIDYINIISVNDGNDGKSSMHLELTQDYISLPCDPSTGGLHEKYDVGKHPISSKMMLYDGDTLIEYDSENPIEYSFKVNGENVSGYFYMHKDNNGNLNGGFDISDKNLIVGDMNIECIATYKGNSFHKTLFIDLEDTPYELEINQSVITRDGDSKKITTDKLAVRVKCWMNGKWQYIKDGKVYLIDLIDSESQPIIGILNIENNDDELCTRSITFSNKTIKGSEVRISYKRNIQGPELSYEIIGVVNSGIKGDPGKDGTAPSLESTKILGYSLNPNLNIDATIDSTNKEDSTVWKSALNYLNPQPSAGQTIYILNEYTWSDGKTTRGITVTLAGTQGVDGKSRVLFYLGSYEREKATLTDPIPTVFNDIRCDYYIDYYGNAWMRKGKTTDGTETESNAVKTVPNGRGLPNTNWEASTKVGFLQADAITAEMINTGSLIADTSFITNLFAQEVEANNLTVNAAKIKGTLTIGNKSIGNSDSDEGDESFNINTGDIIYSINSESNKTTIDGGKITTGTITSEQINVNELRVKNLNTVTDGYKNSVNISENTMSIYDSNDNLVCSFSDDNINFTPDTAFVLGMSNIVINRPLIKAETLTPVLPDINDPNMPDVQPINETLNSTGEQPKQSVFQYTDKKNIDISRIHEVHEIGTMINNVVNNVNVYTYNINHIIKPTLSLGENLLFTGDIIRIKTNLKTTFNFKNILVNDGDEITITRKIFVNVYNSGGVIMKTLYANDGIEVSITTSNDNNEILSIDHGKIEFEDYTITKNDKYRFSVGVKGSVKVTKIKTQSNNGFQTLLSPYNINEYRVGDDSYCEIDATIIYNNVVDGDSDITGDSDINNDTKIYKTLIGKNGLYVNNNNNGMFIGDDGIILKYNEFGLKLTENGIEVSNTLTKLIPKWTQLTIS